MTQH
jgi:hypothetical protein